MTTKRGQLLDREAERLNVVEIEVGAEIIGRNFFVRLINEVLEIQSVRIRRVRQPDDLYRACFWLSTRGFPDYRIMESSQT